MPNANNEVQAHGPKAGCCKKGDRVRIISRRNERRELDRCERSRKSELVCVYGRRRVGKTYLVEQTFAGYFAFRATGVEGGNTRQQLKAFNQRLREHGDGARTIPRDWFEAFSRLESVLSAEAVTRSPHGKRIVFFDEFPWFATAKSDFLMAFGEFWNRCGTVGNDLMLIMCGSSTSWIIGNILENTGSLYDRVTCQVHLEPFCLRETEEFLADREFGWSRRQVAECQMVFGGLPYFLDLLDGNDSLGANIDRLCFAPYALLRNESRKLLEATLRKSPVYGQIVDLLAQHRHGMLKQDCFDALDIPKGTFSRAVDDLVKCGYVWEYKSPRTRRKPLRLQLVDPFLLFHCRFLSSDGGTARNWGDFVHDAGRFSDWRGSAFEILCLGHIAQLKAGLGIAGVRTDEFPWASERREGGAQIDLVIERDDGITNICEMKYTDAPLAISASYEASLLNKVAVFREETGTDRALKVVMVTAEGIAGSAHTEHIARQLTLDDLFA